MLISYHISPFSLLVIQAQFYSAANGDSKPSTQTCEDCSRSNYKWGKNSSLRFASLSFPGQPYFLNYKSPARTMHDSHSVICDCFIYPYPMSSYPSILQNQAVKS